MNPKNLIQLTDDTEDPVVELRLALSQVVRAAGRAVGEAIENSPVRGLARSLLQPRLTVTDNGDEIVVTADLPGIELESVGVTLSTKNVLRITTPRGQRSSGNPATPAKSRDGFRNGSHERSILLQSSIAREKATAVLENGELTVRLPKHKEAQANVPTIGTRAA